MTDPDDRLSELLSDAVSDIEPGNGLDSIRSRTKVTPMTTRRPWLIATGGAVLATAAVITAIALASGNLSLNSADPDPAVSPTAETSASDPVDPTPTSEPVAPTTTVAGYYLGAAPRGVRLYREFLLVEADNPFDAALVALQQTPADPDYSTPWPAGSFSSISFDGIGIDGEYAVVIADGALHDRPEGMTPDEAELAIQQVIYTVQAAGQTRAPVQFSYNGNPIDQVLGVPTSEGLANAPVLETLSLMSITSPAEGEVVSGSFVASGVNNGFEATYAWEIRQGDTVVDQGFGMAEGAYEDKLFPWETDPIDVSDLAAGTYTFAAFNDDPSVGEGGGPDTDTRTIVVE